MEERIAEGGDEIRKEEREETSQVEREGTDVEEDKRKHT